MMKTNHIVCAILTLCCIAFCTLLFAQMPKKPTFEVATIKPLPSTESLFEEIRSGKRSQDSLKTTISGARLDIGASPMLELITRAYSVKYYQVVGPDWLYSLNYEIHAKLPEGASKDQIPEMMQSLLSERFKLVVHREKKEQPVYLLTVSENGHKLKEAIVDADAPAQAYDPAKNYSTKDGADKSDAASTDTKEDELKVSRDGTMSTKKFRTRILRDENGRIYTEDTYFKITMSELAQNLSLLTDRPIVDRTELKGFYEVSMEISMEDMANLSRKLTPDAALGQGAGGITGAAPDGLLSASNPSAGGGIFRQIQKLGLKLEPGRAPVEKLVIDSIEKNPSEN